MESIKKIDVHKINNTWKNYSLYDTIIYFNEKKNNNEIQFISRPIFNKIERNKKLISSWIISENTNNWLKELSEYDEEFENEEDEDIFINIQDIKRRIVKIKMNEANPRTFKKCESSNKTFYAREEILTYERPHN